MDDLFAPPTERWTPLDPSYLRLRRLMVFIVWPIVFIVVSVSLGLSLRSWVPAMVCAAVALPWMALMFWRQGRLFRRWGYAERDTDLYVRHGLLVRQLTIIPYGRMQVVRVDAGPFERAFGVATVTMLTAGPNARIPGLAAPAAAALRDRLSERGQSQQAGL